MPDTAMALKVSTFFWEMRSKTSERAKMPTTTGIRLKPPERSKLPKVKRRSPEMGSAPTMARNRPSTPANSPLSMLVREMLAMQVRPRRIRAKVSMGPKRKANAASWGARSMSTMQESTPPMMEAMVAQPSARSASPRRLMG